VCVQMSWVSCPVQSHVARCNVRGNWSAGSLLNWSRVSKRQGMVSPQARQSGTSDGEDSDSWFWSRRDDFGPYPWDPSWDSPDKDGRIRHSGFLLRVVLDCLLQRLWWNCMCGCNVLNFCCNVGF